MIAPPLDSEAPAKLNPVIDLAKARGVRHIVFVSALGVDAVEQAPLRRVERHLMASGVPWTILRPNFFMENFSTGFLTPMLKQGGIFLAAADGKTSFISVVDIAEVAAVALVKEGARVQRIQPDRTGSPGPRSSRSHHFQGFRQADHLSIHS